MYKNKNTIAFLLTAGILGVLFGILLLAIDFTKIISLIFIIVGIFILIANLPSFIYSITSGNLPGILSSLFPVAAAILLIFWHSSLLLYIVGIYLVILPLVRVLCARDKALMLRVELPRIIIGVLLFIIGPGTAINTLIDVAGYVVIALSVVSTLIGLLRLK